MLPKVRDPVPCLGVVTDSVVMEASTPFWCVHVIPDRKAPDTNRHFFTLKDHGLVEIVRYVDNKVSPRKGKPSSPVRLHLRHPMDLGHGLWLTVVSQMRRLIATTLVVCVAHDGTGLAQGDTVIGDGALDVREVRGEDSHFVLGCFHLLDNVLVPVLGPRNVSIALRVVVLATIHAVTNMTGKNGSDGQVGLHLIDIHAVLVLTKRLFGFLFTRNDGFVTSRIFAIHNLIHDACNENGIVCMYVCVCM